MHAKLELFDIGHKEKTTRYTIEGFLGSLFCDVTSESVCSKVLPKSAEKLHKLT